MSTTEVDKINKMIAALPEEEKELITDGYHSFKELYDHRVKLFVALCNKLVLIDQHNWQGKDTPIKYRAWKSAIHEDGTMYPGWFIAGIGDEEGKTLTYHLPITEWNKMICPAV